MSENLYGAAGATEPDFGAQMDPLGTANSPGFGQAVPGAEPAAGFGAAPASANIEAPPAASVKIGKTITKKKLSIRKKIAFGAGGFLAAFLGLVIVLTPEPRKIVATPAPPATRPAAAEQMGAPGASAGAATVMGGAPTPAPESAAGAQAAFVETPPAAAPAAAQATPGVAPAHPSAASPALAASAQAPAGPTVPPATSATAPAPTGAAAQIAVPHSAPAPAVAPAEKLVMIKDKAPAAAVSPSELASRVAMLEKRLARYEREEARQRAQAAKSAEQNRTAVRVALPAPATIAAAPYRSVAAAPAVEMRKPAMLSTDTVRVIGVSTRHGVTTALVDFGGVKQRVAAGDAIAGLGVVGSIAVDAAGTPVVEVNGVRYQ